MEGVEERVSNYPKSLTFSFPNLSCSSNTLPRDEAPSQNDGLAASETQTEFPVEHNKKPQQWGFDFSIVIPVRDEENNIVPLLQEIQEACDPLYRYEIIFRG